MTFGARFILGGFHAVPVVYIKEQGREAIYRWRLAGRREKGPCHGDSRFSSSSETNITIYRVDE